MTLAIAGAPVEEPGGMKRHTSIALLLAVCWAQDACAQQDGAPLNGTQMRGRQLLAQSCGVCHLPTVLGGKTYGPSLNKSSTAGNDELMRAFIMNGSGRMPAFKHYFQPADVDAIIAYVRTVPAPPVTAENR
jgi:mono/diheme cytochrome c family protein